jgi:periplasmic protein TonB
VNELTLGGTVRRSFTLFSIVMHAVAIAVGLYAQILADSSQLPAPHRPIQFEASQFVPVDIQLPKPRVVHSAGAGDPVSPSVAPVVAPDGVTTETGRGHDVSPTASGPLAGVENGSSLSIEGVGVESVVAPPPATEPIAPVRLHPGMTAPMKVADAAPVYPAVARLAHVQGVVILEAVLDVEGRVDSVRVLRSIAQLDQSAVDAVRRWRFTPALLNGQPVSVVMTVTVNFTLQ